MQSYMLIVYFEHVYNRENLINFVTNNKLVNWSNRIRFLVYNRLCYKSNVYMPNIYLNINKIMKFTKFSNVFAQKLYNTQL